MSVQMSPAQLAKLGVAVPTRKRTTRAAVSGPYHTVCSTCLEEFWTRAAEDRHVAPGHNRFEIVLA